MNRFVPWAPALLGLAVACAAASAQPVYKGTLAPTPVVTEPGKAAPSTDMQEDVEILRRLLDVAFGETYGVPGRKAMAPMFQYKNTLGEAPAGFDHPAPHTEGVYLKDYGVVFTATLPPTGFDPMPGSKPGAGDKTPPDDWDRIRKEIRGDKPEPEVRVVPGHKPLSEVILKVLADNGRHFNLADGERITVAVTFRGVANCANCHQNPWQGPPPINTTNPTVIDFGFPVTKAPNPRTDGVPSGFDSSYVAPAAQPPATPAWLTDVRNAVLLGDLHMKQGKTQDAIAAYQKAAEQLGKAIPGISDPNNVPSMDDVSALLTAVDLCNKMATAQVQAGKPDAAGQLLKEASDLAQKAQRLTGAPATANPQPGAAVQALPPKLVVSASKKLLDDVASGKVTFEAFCKAATVEYVNPTVVKTTTAPGTPGTIAP